MQTKIGISMSMPEGKLPGYYAQIVKALASKTQLFDRDKDLLVVSTPNERDAVLDIMRQYKVDTEELELLLLPEDAQTSPLFDDYGFTTRFDNRYLYRNLVFLFRLRTDATGAEPDQALRQLDEYVIASFTSEGEPSPVYAVDKQHDELVPRLAAAYGCTVVEAM